MSLMNAQNVHGLGFNPEITSKDIFIVPGKLLKLLRWPFFDKGHVMEKGFVE